MKETFEELFITHLFSEFNQVCAEKGMKANMANFLDFLISRQLIPNKTLQQYSLIREFDKNIEQNRYRNKTETVHALAGRFSLHENTIWNILKYHRKRFQDVASIS